MLHSRIDRDFVRSAALAMVTLFMISQLVIAHQLSPATEFTVRNGTQVDSDPFGIFGFIQEGDDIFDETFIEFELASLNAAYDVDLELKVVDRWRALTFDVSTYYGSGNPSSSPFGTGTFLTTLVLGPFPAERTYTIDVTSQVAAAIAGGHAFLGIRLHDPAGIPPGSDYVPFVEYGGASLLYSVPEPSTFVLIGTAFAGLLACGKRKKGLAVRREWRGGDM